MLVYDTHCVTSGFFCYTIWTLCVCINDSMFFDELLHFQNKIMYFNHNKHVSI